MCMRTDAGPHVTLSGAKWTVAVMASLAALGVTTGAESPASRNH